MINRQNSLSSLSNKTHHQPAAATASSKPSSRSTPPPMSATSNSWVPIKDPDSGDIFYANPDSGECTWDLHPGMTVMDSHGIEVWWQLFDDRTSTPYYYSTLTNQTQWSRPNTGVIVNLITIQKHAIGKRVSLAYLPTTQKPTKSLIHESLMNLSIPNASQIDTNGDSIYSNSGNPTNSLSASAPVMPSSELMNNLSNPLDPSPLLRIPESPSSSDHRYKKPHAAYVPSMTRTLHKSASFSDLNNPQQLSSSSNRSNPSTSITSPSTMNTSISPDGNTVFTTALLPTDLRSELANFRIDGFAKKYFREHKRGIFRRRVPVEKLLVWRKESLKLPLLIMSKARHKDALKVFKLILRIMGDRTQPRGYTPYQDMQYILERGVMHGEMRDEIYVQLCKQLTNNPHFNSVLAGWSLMCTMTPTFPPSKNFEEYLKTFISSHITTTTGIGTSDNRSNLHLMATFCLRKLTRSCKNGPRGKTPTIPEIERMVESPFSPSVFGELLDDIMRVQLKSYPHLEYPRIIVFLAQAVLNLNGCATEGIFRIPGDADDITELRLRIEKHQYDMTGITDSNVPAGLLKFWMRELAEPLIPTSLYEPCIAAYENIDNAALKMIDQLPKWNQLVAKFIITFLQVVARPENVAITKMSVQNIAMVFAPNFLRCPSDNPALIFENTKYEQQFLKHLIASAEYNIDVWNVPWK